jgi:hypothetical protein
VFAPPTHLLDDRRGGESGHVGDDRRLWTNAIGDIARRVVTSRMVD